MIGICLPFIRRCDRELTWKAALILDWHSYSLRWFLRPGQYGHLHQDDSCTSCWPSGIAKIGGWL